MKLNNLVHARSEVLSHMGGSSIDGNQACKTNTHGPKSLPDPLEGFDDLPDSAHIRLPVVVRLLGISAATVWRGVRKGTIPAPKHFSERSASWNVGALRELLRAKS